MIETLNLFVVLFLSAAVLCLGLLASILPQRDRLPLSLPLFMCGIAIWLLAYAWEMASMDLAIKIVAGKMQYLGIAVTPTAWLAYTFAYTQPTVSLSRKYQFLLCLEPVALVSLAWTNESHHLIWQRLELLPLAANTSILDIDHGLAFIANIIYTYGLMLWATILLLRTARRSPQMYRGQALLLSFLAACPWLGNILYLAGQTGVIHYLLPIAAWGTNPLLLIDWTPVGFFFAGLVALWSHVRLGLWEVIPIARDAVIEDMQDGVIVLDRQDRILDLNSAAMRLLDIHGIKMLGKSAHTLFGEWPSLLATLEQGMEANQFLATPYTRYPEMEDTRWFELSVSPLHNRRHQPIGRLIIWRDITRDREAALALIAAKEAAEASSRAKSQFLAAMSHELRTPLTAILGYSELLREDCQAQAHLDFIEELDIIHSAGAHLLTLINNVLDFSKLEAGQVAKFVEPFEIAPLLAEVQRTLEPLARQNQNQLILQTADCLPTLHSDVVKVRQILFNLLSNALKFTENGCVTLEVVVVGRPGLRAEPSEAARQQNSQWIRFQIRDTGIGITPAQLDRIFQAFTQADTSIHRQFGGTGLGLSISRSLCQLLGGEITVESEQGVGSTFTVHLPLGDRPANPD